MKWHTHTRSATPHFKRRALARCRWLIEIIRWIFIFTYDISLSPFPPLTLFLTRTEELIETVNTNVLSNGELSLIFHYWKFHILTKKSYKKLVLIPRQEEEYSKIIIFVAHPITSVRSRVKPFYPSVNCLLLSQRTSLHQLPERTADENNVTIAIDIAIVNSPTPNGNVHRVRDHEI